MRKLIVVLAVASLALMAPSAQARTISSKRVTFTAQVPCAVACSYWLPNPASPTDIADCSASGGAPCDRQNAQACSNPFPPESFDQIRVKAPAGAARLKVEGYPVGDWDLAVCTPQGKMVLWIANSATDSCDLAGIMGCVESGATKVKAGKTYIIRAYNWLDTEPLPARYWFYSS